MAFGHELARALAEQAIRDAALAQGLRPGRPGRRKMTEEEEDDPARELVVVAEAIGYDPKLADRARRQLERTGLDRREACSQVMDIMLARQPLGVEETC